MREVRRGLRDMLTGRRDRLHGQDGDHPVVDQQRLGVEGADAEPSGEHGATAWVSPSRTRTGRRSPTTVDINGERASGTAWSITGGCEPATESVDTDCR